MRFSFLHAVLIIVQASVPSAWADSVALSSVADTTLIQLVPDNNMGGHVFFNAGTTLHGSKNRGLLRFDVAGGIPAGSAVISAQVVLEVRGIPIDEPAGATFGLHRLLRSWGEGTNVSVGGPGRGDTATIDEATWNHRFALTTNDWATPGGLAGVDFSSVASGEQFIEPSDNSAYTFAATQMAADVQIWLDNPESNYGWLIKTEDEELRTTARRFASKEDLEYAPQLLVEFQPPPLLQFTRVGSELRISFLALPNKSYDFETTPTLPSALWMSLTNINAAAGERTIHLTNAIGDGTGFFRVLVGE